MRTNYTSTDDTVVLRLSFNPVDSLDPAGSVTVSTAGGSLTIDGTDYTGLDGSFVLLVEQDADGGLHTGTFTLAIGSDATAALSGSVTGAFDDDFVFRPHRFTDVIVAASLGAPDLTLTLLPPPDDDDVAMGTSSVIIKPS